MSARGEVAAPLPVILLVENDDADIFLFRRALGKMGYNCRIHAVHTLAEGRNFLENSGRFNDAAYYERPNLIVSDFRLIGETALDFLRWLSSHPTLASIPFVILTGAGSLIDSTLLKNFGVTTILAKTPDVAALSELLRPVLPTAAA